MTTHMNTYCGYCMRETVGSVTFTDVNHWHIDGDGTFGTDTHYLLKCAICTNGIYRLERTHSENVSYGLDHNGRPAIEYFEEVEFYPKKPKAERPRWLSKIMPLDCQQYRVLSEIYAAIDNDLFLLATGGFRTAVDQVCIYLKIDADARFEDKAAALASTGKLTMTNIEAAHALINAGSAAIHRTWTPTPSQIAQYLDLLERLIDAVYFSPPTHSVKALNSIVPPRPPRKKPDAGTKT